MKNLTLMVGWLFLVGGVATVQAAPVGTAKATIVNAQGEQIGSAQLKQTARGVLITLNVSKLPPGMHAFHIHSVGKCDPPDFKSAGPHFNPTGKKHGKKNPEGHHAGDLPNISVKPSGKGYVGVVVPDVTLGPGPNSLFSPEGTSIVIHAKPDDETTDPAGNAGDRIACGVITQ